jgi:hypothetical protein
MQMANLNEHQLKARKVRKERESVVSPLQRQLAAMVIDNIIEGNGGRAAADVFWDDDSFDITEESEVDPDRDLPDLEAETVPEMDEINHNILECD